MDRKKSLKTKCKLCKAAGTIELTYLRDDQIKIKDLVKHRPWCDLNKRSPVPRHLKQKRWVKQEKRANALVGARETLMSGAVNEDGDGRVFHEWRVESKQTKADKYRLTTQVWEKLCKGALEAGEEPMLHVEIGRLPTRLVLVRDKFLAATPTCFQVEEAQGMIEVNGKGATIDPEELRTPMWIEGMSPTPWILTEAEFKRLSIKDEEQL